MLQYWSCCSTDRGAVLVVLQYWSCCSTCCVALIVVLQYLLCCSTGRVAVLVVLQYWSCCSTCCVAVLVVLQYWSCCSTDYFVSVTFATIFICSWNVPGAHGFNCRSPSSLLCLHHKDRRNWSRYREEVRYTYQFSGKIRSLPSIVLHPNYYSKAFTIQSLPDVYI